MFKKRGNLKYLYREVSSYTMSKILQITNLRNTMKIKNFIIIFLLLFIVTQLNLFAQAPLINPSIQLIFETAFSTPFQSGKPWQNLSEQTVKNEIVNKVTTAYAPYNIPVSLVTGNIIAYIGRTSSNSDLLGKAISGIGSYYNACITTDTGGIAYCEIYSNNFLVSELKGNNATATRIAEAIASTVIHELGHLFNLYHAYTYNSFDPTISGALDAGGYPKESLQLPIGCKTDPNSDKHFMATNISMQKIIEEVKSFSVNSDQALRFVQYAGGTVSQSMVWGVPNGYFYLKNDISINSGKTFIAAGNSVPLDPQLNPPIVPNVLHLNNRKIRVTNPSSGGKIQIFSTGSISPNQINLRHGSNTTGIFLIFNDAFTAATVGETIVVLSGTHTFSSAITIPTGIGLESKSGATMNFNSGLTVNGTLSPTGGTFNFGNGTGLVVNGTTNCQNTLFTGSYNWAGIVLNSSATFISNTIRYAITGLTLTASTYLQGNNIHDCGTGLHISNTSISLPNGNSIQNNNGTNRNGTGVLFSGYSQGLFFPHNKIINNDLNISIQSNAHPDFGVYTGINDQGRNSIYGGYPYDIRSQYTGTISAQCNWWGGYPIYPPYLPYLDVTTLYGSINTDYALTSNPNSSIGIIEENHKTRETSLQKSSIVVVESIEGIKEFDEARALLQDKLKEKEGEKILLNILNKYPDKQSGRLAFIALYYYYNMIKDEGSKKMILLESTNEEQSLSSLAMYFKARDYKERGDYKSAIEELEKVVNKRHSSDIMPYVYYDLGTLYYYNLDDKGKGEKYYRELAEKYPEEAITKTVLSITKLQQQCPEPPTAKEETTVTETKLFANYPNPFNPSTVIKYQLSEASQVSLKVYDVMGREVATLVNSFQNKGSYDINFNANGLSSGIYFYKLNVNGKQHINKMLLMK